MRVQKVFLRNFFALAWKNRDNEEEEVGEKRGRLELILFMMPAKVRQEWENGSSLIFGVRTLGMKYVVLRVKKSVRFPLSWEVNQSHFFLSEDTDLKRCQLWHLRSAR